MVHKDALISYAMLFPPMVAAIDRCRMLEGSPQTMRGLDDTLVELVNIVTFYPLLFCSLCSYVKFVRQVAVTSKASRLVDLKSYVLARDAEKAAQAAQLPLDVVAPPDDEPSIADLLSVAMEVNPCRDNPTSCGPCLSLPATGTSPCH